MNISYKRAMPKLEGLDLEEGLLNAESMNGNL
jgi:hypothetical protein